MGPRVAAAGGHPELEAAARGRVSSQGPSPGDQGLQLFSSSFAQSTCKSPGSEAYCRSELNPLGVGKDWGAGMPSTLLVVYELLG